MNIVVLDGHTLNPGDNPWDEVAALGQLTVHDRSTGQQVFERAREAEAVLTNKTPLTAETLLQLPRLRYIGVLATGFNVVDARAARARGIPVCNVPEYGTRAVAQHVFALLLSLIHRPQAHSRAVRDGAWADRGDFSFWLSPLTELEGKTMGLIGLGRIGRAVADLARAFGMHVLAYTRSRDDTPLSPRSRWADSVLQVFTESDVVSLHCPQTDETRGMVDAALIGAMKPTAYLINTARGGLIDEQALAVALLDGRLAGAGLDVVSSEPIQPNNPLLAARNCLLTPHLAWSAIEARRRLMQAAADNLKAFLAGRPINVVN